MSSHNITKDIVECQESYGPHCLADSAHSRKTPSRRPFGKVDIYSVDHDGNREKQITKEIDHEDNLIVYLGREILGIRLFDAPGGQVDAALNGNFRVCWLGIGKGGVPQPEGITPIDPENTDEALAEELPISPDDGTCGDLRGGQYYKVPVTSIIQSDPDNDNRYLIVRCTATLAIDHAEGEDINEAALFAANSSAAGHSGDFFMFARITFQTVHKLDDRELVFVWYIYV